MRETRGKLSSLDLAPDEAQDDIRWALAELNQRKRSQADILFELNDRLAVKGCEPISKSAFNRKAVRVAWAARRLLEQRAMFEGIAGHFTPEAMDETNLVIGELIKLMISEKLDDPDMPPEDVKHLTAAYVGSIRGQAMSAAHRDAQEAKFRKKAGEAIRAVGQAKGLTSETIEALRAQILGIRKEAA